MRITPPLPDAVTRQCCSLLNLHRRRPAGDRATLERQVHALETQRNQQHRTITWSFTAYDGRTKLRRLYLIPQTEL
jgi:hypothetical protein